MSCLSSFPSEHPWAKRRRVRWGELATQVLITYNKASLTHQLLLDRLAKEEAGAPETMEVREAEAVTEMVKVGLGIAVLPPWVVRADLQARQTGGLATRSYRPETFMGDRLCPGPTVTTLWPNIHSHLPGALFHPHGGRRVGEDRRRASPHGHDVVGTTCKWWVQLDFSGARPRGRPSRLGC